ncbi:SDR family NAD(P)-dependent oxidoreductase [Pseudonocardia sp. N23]|uniref:SDR family NAD(P)-dependent oxidoreductase n=1 Tax=Pseudonocardia sp. N23 TaxID=1987376 RepID=UPI000BFB76B1|nr:SDR family oxidoreductase [Pseudonocardia sp. N23]GAY09007.1 2-deoxy-D-gluconate 3-dehydrogenase [Pseudonocardia sp. N23]
MKTVLVTGAGGGIGAGIARVLAKRDWHVVVNDVSASSCDKVAADIGGTALPGDVTADPAGLAEAALAVNGRLDGLVNNAGIIRRGPLSDLDPADVDAVLGVNLRAVVALSAAALPHLSAAGGAIVNIASMAAEVPQLNGGLYAASKAGVVSFTRQAAVEWGAEGVRVNAIGPGMIRTEMAEAVYADPVMYERRRALIPVGRIGAPEDIGRVVAFLLSDDAAYVSGQHVLVDGALTQTLMAHFPQPPC